MPALRLSLWRTALGMAICPFDEMVALVISTYHGKTDLQAAQLENSYAGKTAVVPRGIGGACFSQGQLIWEIQDLVGTEGARAIQDLIQSAYKPATGTMATVLGVLTLILGASAVMVDLRDALNTIWHVPAAPFSSLRSFLRLVKERFYLFGLILGVGFLLLVSLALNAAIAALGSLFGLLLPASVSVLHLPVFLISFLVITFLFAAIYKFLPDVQLKWSDVIVGACFTSLWSDSWP